jgi:hypothetical protein
VPDLDSIADELYALAPGEFTASRDARASEARKAGDRTLGSAVKLLRKPSTAAWALNQFVRAEPEQVVRLAELGRGMREAQESLSAEDIRALGRQRQQLVSSVAGRVRALAFGAGHPLSESAFRDVESTLEAALADPDAAVALSSGRLTRTLSYAGFGTVDVSEAVGGRDRGGPQGAEAGAMSADDRTTESPAAKATAGQGKDAARRRLDAARASAGAAALEARESAERLKEAEAAVAEAIREVAEAETELGRLEEAAGRARRRLEEARDASERVTTAREHASGVAAAAERTAAESAHELELLRSQLDV